MTRRIAIASSVSAAAAGALSALDMLTERASLNFESESSAATTAPAAGWRLSSQNRLSFSQAFTLTASTPSRKHPNNCMSALLLLLRLSQNSSRNAGCSNARPSAVARRTAPSVRAASIEAHAAASMCTELPCAANRAPARTHTVGGGGARMIWVAIDREAKQARKTKKLRTVSSELFVTPW